MTYPDVHGADLPAEGDATRPIAFDLITEPGGVTIEAAGGAVPKLPRVSILAYTGVAMRLPGWSIPVVVELAGMELPAELPILADHDAREPIAHGAAEIAGGKLTVRGVVSVDSEKAREFVQAAKNRFPWQASVGIQWSAGRFYAAGEMFEANSRTFTPGKNGIYLVTKSKLREVSVMSLGADENTSVNVAAASRGLERTMPESTMTAKEIRAAERDRVNRIESACRGIRPEFAGDLQAKALDEEITFDQLSVSLLEAAKGQAELDQLRSSRLSIASVHNDPGAEAGGLKVIEAAAVLTTIGQDKIAEAYNPATLEAAEKLRGLGIQELIVSAAALEGVSLPRFRNQPNQWLRAAFSTMSVPGILSDVATKVLLAAFNSVEQTWRAIAKASSVSDFKTSPRYRLTANMKYELVAADGELKHGTLGEESYDLKADTYGKMLGITRQDIINDDLGAFAQIPSALGRGAGLSLNEIFWTAFMDNVAFFTAARNNYAEGTDTALDIDSLTTAEQMFLDQVDADGHPIGIPPITLLTPTDLNATATQLTKSLELRGPGTGTKVPVMNPHAGKFTAVASTYLKNSNYTGYSAKAWYLLADANVLPVIEVAFLNGREAPTIETADANFNTLGIEMRGYHDFAVSLAEYRGGVRMKGEV